MEELDDTERGVQRLLTLTDFAAGEDMLAIELSRPALSVEIINEENISRVEIVYEIELFGEDGTSTTIVEACSISLFDPNVTADDVIISVADATAV